MGQALRELEARMELLRNDIQLLENTFELRPRIYEVLNFENRGAVLEVAKRFAEAKGAEPATFCGPLLVRLAAAFERYLRMLMREAVESWEKRASSFDDLPDGLGERNLILSGRVIGSSDSPRDHITINLQSIIDNLATCRAGSTSFRLNSAVFMEIIYGVTSDVIEKSLHAVRIKNWPNAVGADRGLQQRLGQTRVPDTTKEMNARLKRLSRRRNNWAHGGDDEVSLTFPELRDELEFVLALGRAIDSVATKQFGAA
jgi:hypothetical protein